MIPLLPHPDKAESPPGLSVRASAVPAALAPSHSLAAKGR